MRMFLVVPAAAAALLMLLGFGGQGGVAPSSVNAPLGGDPSAAFDPKNFGTDSANVTNRFLPLKPGTQLVYTGTTQEGDEEIPHEIIFTVTDLKKKINGIDVAVVWDRDISDGSLVETELNFFAQDRSGNVWHMGEYTESWEDGDLIGGQAWMVGHLRGAKAGLQMLANPTRGIAYSQGFAPAPYNWNDWGKVAATRQQTCVPAKCFNRVIVIDEYEPDKPNAFQTKWHAPGVGVVRVGWKGKDADHEVLRLKRIVRLSAAQLAKARTEALKLETRAYVYGSTEPAKQR